MIYVDTSFWVALLNSRDNRHADAVALLDRHADASLVTSTLVRGETWTFLNRRHGHGTATAFLDRVGRSPRIDVVALPLEVDGRALEWLKHRAERAYSYVDATSFVLMTSMRIRSALAFDGDFSAAGFIELRP